MTIYTFNAAHEPRYSRWLGRQGIEISRVLDEDFSIVGLTTGLPAFDYDLLLSELMLQNITKARFG